MIHQRICNNEVRKKKIKIVSVRENLLPGDDNDAAIDDVNEELSFCSIWFLMMMMRKKICNSVIPSFSVCVHVYVLFGDLESSSSSSASVIIIWNLKKLSLLLVHHQWNHHHLSTIWQGTKLFYFQDVKKNKKFYYLKWWWR